MTRITYFIAGFELDFKLKVFRPVFRNMKIPCKNCANEGFTLLELMITLAIAAILFAMALPSFKGSIRSNRLTTITNELIASLNLARSEAIKRGQSVTVRKVDDNSATNFNASANWEDGWDVFTDADGDGNFVAGDGDTLIRTYQALSANYTLRGDTEFPDFISFGATGLSNNTARGSFTLCDSSDGNTTPEANTAKLILINTVGRTRMGVDSNNDGIPNTDNVVSTASNITNCTPT